MADWPLILAGPILRKVTPTEVSVWIALKEPRTVHLSIYPYAQGDTSSGGAGVYTGSPIGHGHLSTMKFGPKCHVAVVTANLSNTPLTPVQPYCYNVGFADMGSDSVDADLKTEKLLTDAIGPNNPRPHLNLGYFENFLPSFALVPPDLNDLQILHGSCRKGHGEGPDAMKWIDKLIEDTRNDHKTRPHQLFLTGDQIYADEIIPPLLDAIIPIAHELMGTEDVPTSLGVFPCDRQHFPPGLREEMMLQEAGFTTGLGDSHLMTFGEFMAMYMMNWSNAVWPAPPLRPFETIVGELINILQIKNALTSPLFLPRVDDATPQEAEAVTNWLLNDAERLSKVAQTKVDELDESSKNTIEDFSTAQNKMLELAQDALKELFEKDERWRNAVKDMYDALPYVRRALANVPTYMIMDDHEVTDDWNVTQEWGTRVYNKPMGRYIVRNALASYVVCQAWGNDPKYFFDEFGGVTLAFIKKGYATPFTTNPPELGILDKIFGIDPANESGWVDPGSNIPVRVRLHFKLEGQQHLVIVLDTRTRREFQSFMSPPALLNLQGLDEQIPTSLLDGGIPTWVKVVVVVSPAPVVGPALVEETVWPGLMRVWDLMEDWEVMRFRGHTRWDAEAWGFNPIGFERFLARLARLQRPVVFLAGDVHYSVGAKLDYFPKVPFKVPLEDVLEVPPKTRFIQFTCSAVKNSWPSEARAILRDVALPQLFLRFASKLERLGWNTSTPQIADTVFIPNNSQPCPADLLVQLQKSPVLIPTKRWPKDTTVVREPDWSWTMMPLFDERPDTGNPPVARPEGAQPPPLPAGLNFKGDHQQKVSAYAAVADRHIKTLKTNTHMRKLISNSNIGWVKFFGTDESRYVEQYLYSPHPETGLPDAFTRFHAELWVDPAATQPDIVNWEEPEYL